MAAAMRDLSRLFRPRSIVVFGGSWAENVIQQSLKSGFDGDIWPVHPKRDSIAGIPCFRSLEDLPGIPDAAFLGINRHAVIEVTAGLSAMGCGGAVCFASGFAESGDADLQDALVAAAADMPLLGPNCYGVLNYLDGAMLWPDQHGGRAVDSGVAIISQSSNIAINISMQARGLPIAYTACVGNQAQTSVSDMARTLLADDRVTAAGLYIEGIIDPVDFAIMASDAAASGKNIVAIKAGKTDASQEAANSHTAALAGDSAASSAFLRQCGVIEADSIEEMLEILKILNLHGRLAGRNITAMCCSGGEAGLIADLSDRHKLNWPDIPAANRQALSDTLGPLVAIANPLDYHTFIWGDEDRMTDTFAAMMGPWVDLSVLVIDFPRADRCSDAAWQPAVAAMKRASERTGTAIALLGSIAEGISDEWASQLAEDGVVALCGFSHGLRAIEAAATPLPDRAWSPHPSVTAQATRQLIDEATAKSMIAEVGLSVPKGVRADTADELEDAASQLTPPLALKGLGHAHKSEAGLVKLGLAHKDLRAAAASMEAASGFLVEEMAPAPVAEMLIGLRRDPVYGITLTLGMGGVSAELLRDVTTLVLPVSPAQIREAILGLKLAPMMTGYRGRTPADLDAVVASVDSLAGLMTTHPQIDEIEINPLMAGPVGAGQVGAGAMAVDAVIWTTSHISPEERQS